MKKASPGEKNTTVVESLGKKRYNKDMPKAKKLKPKSKIVRQEIGSYRVAQLVLAGYLLIFLLLQLFTFEKFPSLISAIGLAGGWAVVVAIALVLAELMAMPFLLSIEKLPEILRKISAASVFLALAGLSVLEVLGLMAGQLVMLGATLELPGGSWSLLMLAALWILAIWAVFGKRLVERTR